jgi:hypothetical protein
MCGKPSCAANCRVCVAKEERASKLQDRSAKPQDRRSKETDKA